MYKKKKRRGREEERIGERKTSESERQRRKKGVTKRRHQQPAVRLVFRAQKMGKKTSNIHREGIQVKRTGKKVKMENIKGKVGH